MTDRDTPPAITTLKKRRDFVAARSGARFHGSAFVLQAYRPLSRVEKNCTSRFEIRFGYTVTKRIGNAVIRNRIKRRLRAAVSSIASDIPPVCAGLDIVVIARHEALRASFNTLTDDLCRGLNRLVAKEQTKGQ